ncbi:MAG: MMPL family transporter [Solirubrobacteraceae bacterium]|nr:MMPL family transporter [Solirubrobacteraceae bacterium]
MIDALVRLATGRARLVLVATAIFFVLAALLGGPVASKLSSGDDFRNPDAESAHAQDRLATATKATAAPGVIVLVETPAGARKAAARRKVAQVTRRSAQDPEVARVSSFTTTGDPRFIAQDGTSTYIAVFGDHDAEESDIGKRLEAAFAGDPEIQVGGPGPAFEAIGDQVEKDLRRAELLAFPILFLLSLWVFRGVVAALLPLFVGGLVVVGTFLALRIVNEALLLSVFALNLAIGLGLGLAIDYSLFVVSRFREEIARGLDTTAAVAQTMRTAGRTVLFSSATVAAALLSLLVFPQRFLYSMAISGSITALLAAAVSLIALPALLMVLGPRVDALAPKRWQLADADAERGFWYRLSRGVMRRPLFVALATAAVLILAGLPFLRIDFTGIDARILPADVPAKQIDAELRTSYARGVTEPITIALRAPKSAAPAVTRYAERLDRLADTATVDTPAYLGRGIWQVNIVPAQAALDDPTKALVRAVRATDAPGSALVAGQTARFVDQQQALSDRLPWAIAILAITTLVILFLMTGSVVLPIKALIMNLLGLSAAFGLLVLIFQDGRFEGLLDYESQGALESTQPLLLLAIAFGLSTDYGVFLLTRIKEARDGGLPNDEAVALGLQRTGRIITAAALLFCVAIGAFATSKIVFIKEVGVGTALAVLIDATIIRALLVPALMELLGEWNWWAPGPLRRLHARIGLDEGGGPPEEVDLLTSLREAHEAAAISPAEGAAAAARTAAAQHVAIVRTVRSLHGASPEDAAALGRTLHTALDGRDELGGAILIRDDAYGRVLATLGDQVETELQQISTTLGDGELAGPARTSLSAARRRLEQVRAGVAQLLA